MDAEQREFVRRKAWVLWGFSILWFAGTALFLGLYVWPELAREARASYELVKAAFESIAAYGVLFALLLASYNGLEAALQQKAQDARRKNERKVEYSFQLLDRMDESSQDLARDVIRRYYKTPLDPQAQRLFYEELQADVAKTRSFVSRLNLYGRMLHAVDEDVAEERILKDSLNNTYGRTYLLALPWLCDQVPALEPDLKGLYERWGSYTP